MNRPYIICHMVQSVDGKVTGDFLSSPQCAGAVEYYYEINRKLKCNGFICGRVTMEGSFTEGWYPDLASYEEKEVGVDYIPSVMTGFYAVSFDRLGRLGWKSAFIEDEDTGYDKAQIIEVLTKAVDRRYLGYLQEQGIAYIFADDVSDALEKLYALGVERILLEGGSIINGAFLLADAVDELSLVVAPVTAHSKDKPLFSQGSMESFSLIGAETEQGNLWLRYKKADS